MRKKFSALIFIALILGSTLSPIFGVEKAKANSVDMADVFPPANTPIDPYTWLVKEDNLKLIAPEDAPGSLSSTAAKLKLNVKITSTDSVQEINPHDMNGNGYLDSGDADYAGGENNFGGWDSILDDNAEASSANGLFLVVGTGTILNTLPEDSNIGGRIALDQIIDNVTISDPDDQTKPVVYKLDGDFPNIGYYVFQKSAVAMFPLPHQAGRLGNAQIDNISIPIGNLQPNTTYHARILLKEDVLPGGASIKGFSNIVTFTTLPQGTAGATEPITINETDTATGVQTGEQQQALFGELIECDALDFYTWGGCFVYFFYTIIYHASHFLLQMAGLLFDFFIGFSLSSKVYGQTTFVYDGWKIVRDISNIFFIFILMYAAIGMILKLHHFDAKKIIAKVIIIGLLINFSLFFTRVVIDASNVLARVFYNEINISNTEDMAIADPAKTGLATKGLSSGIVEGMNIANILSDQENFNKIKNSGEIGSGTIFLIVLIGLIVNLITAWTFITVCMYFVGRILGLWFAMIFSPMAFVTNIVPGLGSKLPKVGWGSWVSNLTNLAIMAPIFVFFMYLIMAFLKADFIGDMILSNNANFTLSEFLVTILLRFMLIIGLIQSAKGLAKKLSGEFGDAVAGVAKGVAAVAAGGAVGLAAGGAAILGRSTAGALMSKMDTAGARERAKQTGLRGAIARRQLDIADYGKKGSFDVRQSGLANKVSQKAGLNFNTGTGIPGLKQFNTANTAGGREGVATRKQVGLEKRAEKYGREDVGKKAIIEGEIEKRKGDLNKQEEIVDNLKEVVAQAKLSSTGMATFTDPTTGVSVTKSKEDWQKELSEENTNLRELKKGRSAAYATTDIGKTKPNGTTITAADVGKKFQGLEQLEKALETNKKAGVREYLANNMKYQVGDPKLIHGEERDAFGNIKKFGHVDAAAARKNGKYLARSFMNAIMDDLAAGGVVAATGLVTGVAPLAVGISGVSTPLITGALSTFLTKTNASLKAAEDASHNAMSSGKDAHAAHAPKDTYKGASSKFFSSLSSLGSSGGGGGGGHDDHGGGHDDHGGGGGHH